ncbi:MAG: sensor histidine kinase [Actinomycetes bacterium]
MDVLLEVVRVVELVVCLAVAALLAPRWRQHRSPATATALGIFVLLATVIASAFIEPADPSSGLGALYSKTVIVVLLALPTLLVMFSSVLGGVSRRVVRGAVVLYAVQAVATVVLPPLPDDDVAERPTWVLVYTAVVLIAWTAQTVVAALGLWRSGRQQSSVVRHRMRSLSIGALLLALTLVVSGATSGGQGGAVTLAIALAGLLSILLFALAFLLPSSLRLVWRQADLAALAEAERGLMSALTSRDVASTIVPVLARVFGGQAAVIDRTGMPFIRERAHLPDVQLLASLVTSIEPVGDAGVRQVAPGVLAASLRGGWVVVQGGRLAPVFGDDEAALLRRVATSVDLALQRVELFEREQESRLAAEAANAELETLLYSVSHDLRSPLISVLGYLDVLRLEHAAELTGDGPHYLERISVNAVYMQSLISDLLELSRIGRTDAPAGTLDLDEVAAAVVEGARLTSPRATVQVGPLPSVRMNDVRARQLLTNLVDNALRHGGRDDLRVTVSWHRSPAGDLVLEVADDGRGIPAEYRDRVLRVFERLDAPKTSPGTGMGLAICKRIVDSHGGTLAVGGPPPGAATGTTVRVVLPAGVVVAEPAEGAVLPGPRPSAETEIDLPLEENA